MIGYTVELPANKTYRVYCTSTCHNRQVSQIWSLVCPILELIVKGLIRKEFCRISWTLMPLLHHLFRRSSHLAVLNIAAVAACLNDAGVVCDRVVVLGDVIKESLWNSTN